MKWWPPVAHLYSVEFWELSQVWNNVIILSLWWFWRYFVWYSKTIWETPVAAQKWYVLGCFGYHGNLLAFFGFWCVACQVLYVGTLGQDWNVPCRVVFCAVLYNLLWAVIGQQWHLITTARQNNDGPMIFDNIDDKREQRRRARIGKPYIKLKLLIRGRHLYSLTSKFRNL